MGVFYTLFPADLCPGIIRMTDRIAGAVPQLKVSAIPPKNDLVRFTFLSGAWRFSKSAYVNDAYLVNGVSLRIVVRSLTSQSGSLKIMSFTAKNLQSSQASVDCLDLCTLTIKGTKVRTEAQQKPGGLLAPVFDPGRVIAMIEEINQQVHVDFIERR